MPIVSVIMAVYNGEKYLAEAIDSVLVQTYSDFELIIIDDGSSDHSVEIICSYTDPRIKLIKQIHQGLPYSLNHGINTSLGRYIARMDADDVSEPQRFEKQVEFLNNNPEFVVVGTSATVIDEEGFILGRMCMPQGSRAIIDAINHCSSPLIHGSVMCRKHEIMEYGLYDTKMSTAQDWYLWHKVSRTNPMANLPDALYRYRLTPGAISTMTPAMMRAKQAILERVIRSGNPTENDYQELQRLKKGLSPGRRKAQYFIRAAKWLLEYNWQPKRAIGYCVRSIYYYPLDMSAWGNLLFCFLPRPIVAKWKSKRSF